MRLLKRPTITVILQGGLGNQLFQFAAAYALSRKLSASLVLDLRKLHYDPKRIFELSYLDGLVRFKLRRPNQLAVRLRNRLIRSLPAALSAGVAEFVETSFEFDSRFNELSTSTILSGYFQSYRYFSNLKASEIKGLMPPPVSEAEIMEAQISACEAVAVHIRRGDYVSESKTNEVHGVLPSVYYALAAEFVASKVANPVFFVFSDDPYWVKSAFQFPFAFTAVDIVKGPSGLTDLRLMAKCKHHIIANSTMSWWGAHLASWAGQVVVAPLRWFANHPGTDRDLVPEHWKRF